MTGTLANKLVTNPKATNTEKNGATNTLATGPIRESDPNAGNVSGKVAACATREQEPAAIAEEYDRPRTRAGACALANSGLDEGRIADSAYSE